jgi:hypothetical protein
MEAATSNDYKVCAVLDYCQLNQEALFIIQGFILHLSNETEQINLIKFILVKNDFITETLLKVIREWKLYQKHSLLACKLIVCMFELFSKQNVNFVKEIFDKFGFPKLLSDLYDNETNEELAHFCLYISENFYD